MSREQRRKSSKNNAISPDRARKITEEYENIYSAWLRASGANDERLCKAIKNDSNVRICYNGDYKHDNRNSFAISIANSVGTYGEPFVWDGISPAPRFWIDMIFLLKLIAAKVECDRFSATVNEFVKNNQHKALETL